MGKYLPSHHHYCQNQPAVIFPGGSPSTGSSYGFSNFPTAAYLLWALTWHICSHPILPFKYLIFPMTVWGADLSSF